MENPYEYYITIAETSTIKFFFYINNNKPSVETQIGNIQDIYRIRWLELNSQQLISLKTVNKPGFFLSRVMPYGHHQYYHKI